MWSCHRIDLCDDESCLKHAFRIGRTGYHFDWRGWVFRIGVWSILMVWLLSSGWILNLESASEAGDVVSGPRTDSTSHFDTFSGRRECGTSLPDLYTAPERIEGHPPRISYCPNRRRLLGALSGGGRHGFGAPYTPTGCHYKWYTAEEICMILKRFDSLVFIGDSTLSPIYAGLNILLRKDLSLGSLKPADLSPNDIDSCTCDNQFTRDACSAKMLTSSTQLNPTDRSQYICNRIPAAYLLISPGEELSPSTLNSLRSLIPHAPASNYHPIPLITSLAPTPRDAFSSTSSTPQSTKSLTSLLSFTDSTHRKTPILWLGPTAPGHLDTRKGIGNPEIWTYAEEMERVARGKGVESLGMWNLTVQAESWDGRRFGLRVALVQAMMVINWLGMVESS